MSSPRIWKVDAAISIICVEDLRKAFRRHYPDRRSEGRDPTFRSRHPVTHDRRLATKIHARRTVDPTRGTRSTIPRVRRGPTTTTHLPHDANRLHARRGTTRDTVRVSYSSARPPTTVILPDRRSILRVHAAVLERSTISSRIALLVVRCLIRRCYLQCAVVSALSPVRCRFSGDELSCRRLVYGSSACLDKHFERSLVRKRIGSYKLLRYKRATR